MNAPDRSWPAARVAVVGSGIAGLTAAHVLRHLASVSLFEAAGHFGGHARTVDIEVDGQSAPVDTGFLVFNHRTYPGLTSLFQDLGVRTAPSDMSLSVQDPAARLEWCGSNLDAVFAQRANLLRPRFWSMLRDITRFNRLASALMKSEAGLDASVTLEDFLAAHRFGEAFRDDYLLPMVASIWSCPARQMLQFPVCSLLRFCHNHGLLQLNDRPQWHTVVGGSREYVSRIVSGLADTRLNTPVRRVRRVPSSSGDAGVRVQTDRGEEHFDHVILACHSPQSLAMLADATDDERAVLGAIGYQRNTAVLHTDASLLPVRHKAWAAWNFEAGHRDGYRGVCLHYLLNRLQPLPWHTTVVESLNPLRWPDDARVLDVHAFEHPVFDAAALAAQRRLPSIQGRAGVWYCGAWAGYGFHEDGLQSGLAVAGQLREMLAASGPRLIERAAA
jgi:predicted NAD/FAD-binding protein